MAHTKGVVSRGLHKGKLIQTNADNPLLTVTICGVFGNDETANADANLIVDAFNVTNETGLTPRELLSQRDELVELIHDAGSQIVSVLYDVAEFQHESTIRSTKV